MKEGQGKENRNGTHLRYVSQYKLLLVNSRHVLKTYLQKVEKHFHKHLLLHWKERH